MPLYCFSNTGHLKWKYQPGGRISDAQGNIEPVYFYMESLFLPRTRLSDAAIIAAAIHVQGHASQIAKLDLDGNVKSQYWHSGHLAHLASADIDGDGVPEVLAGGVNNGYRKATLVVLDLRSIVGASTQPPGDRRQIQNVPTGTEKTVIFFPQSCITQLNAEYNRVYHVRVYDDSIQVFVMEDVSESHPRAPYIIYSFDRSLHLVRVTVSDQFVSWHKTLESQGKLHHHYSEKEAEAFYNIEVLHPSKTAGTH